MTALTRKFSIAIAALTACIATGLIIHYARADTDDKPAATQSTATPAGDTEKTGTASVTTAPLREGEVAQTLTAYGSVTTQPGAVEIFSVPYECQVSKIEITAGQPLEKGTSLINVKPSPGAKLAMAEAQSNLESASKDLEQTQQRFNMKLGTNSDLLQSQQAAKLAQLRLDNLNQQGAGEDHRTLSTDNAGLVAKVDVQQGQIVPAGNPLIETIARDQVEVRLGIEPSEISNFKSGQAVNLFPGNTADSIPGKIRLITQRVNPDTRLVDIFVTPDNRDALLLEGFVRGEIVTNTKAALIAPHDAVLPDDEGLLVYTIKDGHAVKHIVTTGAHNNKETAVIGNDLHPGDAVVIQGNLELEDGMSVTTDGDVQVKVSFWANRHARSILFLLIALIAGGVLGTLNLPVSLFPHINFPRIRVNFDSGDRPAEQMMVQVTRPVEEALRAVPGVRSVHSVTNRGGTEISLAFEWGQDMTTAALQVQGEINRLVPSMPPDTTFELRRMDPTVFPVIAYSITSDKRSLTELHDLAQYQIRPVLLAVPGVTKIAVAGGAVEEYRVTLDPEKLAAHSLALNDVTTALTAANVLSAVGHIEDRFKLYLVVADTRFKSLDEIGKTVIRSGGGGITTLADIAKIESTEAPQYTYSVADGKQCVLMQVFQPPDANTPKIATAVADALAIEQKRLPADVQVKCWYDQSDLIKDSAGGVRDAVIIGVALAALVLLLFLRNWRMTLIATVSVPVVLAITALVLYALGQSFNIMTLGGMAAAVGLIIDDAIVVSEHIIRRLHKPVGTVQDTVLNAANEFSRPLSGSSLSTIIIHIPPIFLVGVFGAFFAALSLSMATSLIVSFFVAWLFIPVLAVRFLKGVKESEAQGRIASTTAKIYSGMMRPILRMPLLVALIVLPLIVVGYVAFTNVKSDVLPTVDGGTFNVDYDGPPGASIAEMNRLLAKAEQVLRETPEVDTYSRRTGFTTSGDLSETNTGDFYVRLKKLPRRNIEAVMEEFKEKVQEQAPGLHVKPSQLMEDLLDDLSGAPQPIVVNLFSDDEAALRDLAPKVFDAMGKLQVGKNDELDMDDNGVVPAGDAINVQVDRVKASLEGMDPDAITRSLTTILAGSVTTQIQKDDKLIDVRVWTPSTIRQTTDDLATLQLRAPDGHLFPLGRVATFDTIPGQPEITRQDLKRVVSVTAHNKVDLGTAVTDVQKLLDDMQAKGTIPTQVRCVIGGLKDQQDANNRGIIMVVIAAATLVFLLLLFMYERLRVAGAILSLTLLAVASVFIGLWITRTQFNISSMMGMVMIVGNVTEVAIFFYSEYSTDTKGTHSERLIAAGNQRMRAITMTTAAAILALLPLALDLGHAGGMLQPLAIAIITGLIVQLPLVLIVLPALLAMFKSKTDAT